MTVIDGYIDFRAVFGGPEMIRGTRLIDQDLSTSSTIAKLWCFWKIWFKLGLHVVAQ